MMHFLQVIGVSEIILPCKTIMWSNSFILYLLVAHASVYGVAQILGHQKFAGFALNKELFFLSKLLIDQPIRPVAAIIGGAKISTKLGILSNLIDKVDKILIGGGMVFTFYRSIHLSTGDSIVEESLIKDAANIINCVTTKSIVFRIATDCLVASTSYIKAKKSCKSDEELHKLKERHLEAKVVQHDEIPIGWTGLDIGQETIKDFITELDSCNTILWNGEFVCAYIISINSDFCLFSIQDHLE